MKYKIRSQNGDSAIVEANRPPTADEVDEIFSSQQPPAPQPVAEEPTPMTTEQMAFRYPDNMEASRLYENPRAMQEDISKAKQKVFRDQPILDQVAAGAGSWAYRFPGVPTMSALAGKWNPEIGAGNVGDDKQAEIENYREMSKGAGFEDVGELLPDIATTVTGGMGLAQLVKAPQLASALARRFAVGGAQGVASAGTHQLQHVGSGEGLKPLEATAEVILSSLLQAGGGALADKLKVVAPKVLRSSVKPKLAQEDALNPPDFEEALKQDLVPIFGGLDKAEEISRKKIADLAGKRDLAAAKASTKNPEFFESKPRDTDVPSYKNKETGAINLSEDEGKNFGLKYSMWNKKNDLVNMEKQFASEAERTSYMKNLEGDVNLNHMERIESGSKPYKGNPGTEGINAAKEEDAIRMRLRAKESDAQVDKLNKVENKFLPKNLSELSEKPELSYKQINENMKNKSGWPYKEKPKEVMQSKDFLRLNKSYRDKQHAIANKVGDWKNIEITPEERDAFDRLRNMGSQRGSVSLGGEDQKSRSIVGYKVIDRQTGNTIKEYGPDKGRVASRFVDKKDNEYGAYRYTAKPIFSDENQKGAISLGKKNLPKEMNQLAQIEPKDIKRSVNFTSGVIPLVQKDLQAEFKNPRAKMTPDILKGANEAVEHWKSQAAERPTMKSGSMSVEDAVALRGAIDNEGSFRKGNKTLTDGFNKGSMLIRTKLNKVIGNNAPDVMKYTEEMAKIIPFKDALSRRNLQVANNYIVPNLITRGVPMTIGALAGGASGSSQGKSGIGAGALTGALAGLSVAQLLTTPGGAAALYKIGKSLETPSHVRDAIMQLIRSSGVKLNTNDTTEVKRDTTKQQDSRIQKNQGKSQGKKEINLADLSGGEGEDIYQTLSNQYRMRRRGIIPRNQLMLAAIN